MERKPHPRPRAARAFASLRLPIEGEGERARRSLRGKPSPSGGGLGGAGVGVDQHLGAATLPVMKGQTNSSILRSKLQRRLRNTSTDAERALWQRLRLRQLDDCKFRRQHPFGDYILDFACLERMLIVEPDGSQHADATKADAERTMLLERAGFRVLRFWNNQVFEDRDGVLAAILQALETRATTPSPPRPSP